MHDEEDEGRTLDETPQETGPDAAAPTQVPRGTPFSQQVGRVVMIAAAVVFGVFAVSNRQYVDFSWIVSATEVTKTSAGERVGGGVPLILLLVVAFVLGLTVGVASGWRRRRQLKRALKGR